MNQASGERRMQFIFLRGLQGEDKPSPLLWTTWRPARSIVGAMACPRPVWVATPFTRRDTHRKHMTHNRK